MLAHTRYLTDPRVRREAEALAENGIDVHVIALAEERQGMQEGRNETINGVKIHRLPVDRKRGSVLRYFFEYFVTLLLGAFKLAQLHFQDKLDVVHIHNMPDMLVLAAIVPLLGGCKLVLDIHDPMPELYMTRNHGPGSILVRLLQLQEKLSCWLADRIISVNETMREQLHAKGVPSEKILIVNNFPDLRHFPICDVPEAWPRSDNLTLLYCGTVTEHYDLGVAIKAIAALTGEIPIKFRIMGDGNRLSDVLELASSLGVNDSIEVVGKVSIEGVAEEMRKADVGISCHRAGVFGDLYFPTKILEYLTQGLPVITSQTYTIVRYVPDDCLFYFEPGNDRALAEAIRFMWNSPSEVLMRLNKGRALLSRLCWQEEKTKLSMFYADLLNETN